jgi:3-dehydroquinate synthase
VCGPLVVPGGENAKNGWNTVRELMTLAGAEHLDRHSYLVAVGGGSVLDMAGFAASLVHRGLRLVRVPTTVLSQNDAGVGIKNGMNAGGAKNFAGTFAPPFAVIDDFDFLKTLPQREWIGGVSEAFKVAIIKDKRFFGSLCRHAADLRDRNQAVMEKVVRTTAALHLRHIATSGDPFEFGSARPLDFGHWAAHRLELLSDFPLGHGPAVAVGIALDSTYAMLKKFITPEEREAIVRGLAACGLPVWSPLLERCGAGGGPDVLAGIEQFREHLGGRLCITLPAPVGAKREVHTLNVALVKRAAALLKPDDDASEKLGDRQTHE